MTGHTPWSEIKHKKTIKKLLMFAYENIDDDCPVVFIHPTGREATHVLVTLTQYNHMMDFLPRPLEGRDWNHDHVEPEMLDEW